jgi:hypothetical protein
MKSNIGAPFGPDSKYLRDFPNKLVGKLAEQPLTHAQYSPVVKTTNNIILGEMNIDPITPSSENDIFHPC